MSAGRAPDTAALDRFLREHFPFYIAAIVLTFHVARPFFAHAHWAWLAGLLAVVEPNLAYGNVAGMEVPLFSVFTLAAVWLSQRRHFLITGILLGLGVVTRAEATLDALV